MKKIIDIDKYKEFFRKELKNTEPYNDYDDGYTRGLSKAYDWIFSQPTLEETKDEKNL